MPFTVQVERFEGPLDLLLQLVESEKLEITEISLVSVCEPFIQHLEANRGSIPTEELADFLVVAAKLVYLKSRAILPSFTDAELEEGPDLATQLRLYKAYADAAKLLAERTRTGKLSFNRNKVTRVVREVQFSPPPDVTAEGLAQLFLLVVKRLQPLIKLPQAAIERVVTIEEKMSQLRERITKAVRVSFKSFLAESSNKKEAIVAFLALLELVKQRVVSVKQPDLFEEIHLESV